MDLAHGILAVLLASVCIASAVADFKLLPRIVESMEKLRMPTRLIPALGVAKIAGAIGLLAGLSNGALGTYAAVCLSVYFLLATGLHLRARDTVANTTPAAVLMLTAIATLLTGL